MLQKETENGVVMISPGSLIIMYEKHFWTCKIIVFFKNTSVTLIGSSEGEDGAF